jgi:rsbT antagonist protein RsbS
MEGVKEIPILEYRKRLIVSMQTELTDSLALQLQESILQRIQESPCSGLVIDISGLEMVDSFIARVFMETAHMARLMNVDTVMVGMKPEVALTLVQMGFTVKGVYTAPNLEMGLDLLESLESEREEMEENPEMKHAGLS